MQVDPEDLPRVSKYRWVKNRLGYWSSFGVDGKVSILLHRFILSAPAGSIVDHINNDRSDNRKENLRFVTPSLNKVNARKKSGRYTSEFKGVCLLPHGAWRVQFCGKHVGCFATEREAAQAYNAVATAVYGGQLELNDVPND